MSLDYTVFRFQTTSDPSPNALSYVAVRPRTWWPLAQIVLATFFASYVVGIVQDFQRVRELRAEPSRLAKIIVITKNEAWQRIYSRAARFQRWQITADLGVGGPTHP